MNAERAKVVATLLGMAADHFSNHSCNDFNLTEVMPDREERRALMKAIHAWNGDPDEPFDENGDFKIVNDWVLMRFFSDHTNV